MNLFFIIPFLLIFNCTYSSEYKLSSPPKELLHGDNIIGFNDECQILFAHSPVNRLELFNKGYLLNHNGESAIIDFQDRNEFWSVNLFPVKINNKGTVLGRREIYNRIDGTGTVTPFIWQEDKGVLNHHLPNLNSVYSYVEDLNDLDWFIGKYTQNSKIRPYLCKNNKTALDMGENSGFCKHFEKVGYHVIDIELKAINNKGQLAGWFSYGRYDIQQKKYFRVGYETFFWDGNLIHVLPLPYSFKTPPSIIKINNIGSVIMRFEKPQDPYEKNSTFFWNSTKGIEEIKGFNGNKINDQNIIIGEKEGIPALWEEYKIVKILRAYDNSRETENAVSVNRLVDINNKGKILSTGVVDGKTSFFVIEIK